MRIIAWNANHNNHAKRTYAEASQILFAQGADLIVLSEVALPVEKAPGRIDYVGKYSPGLVVEARNGYTIASCNPTGPIPPLFGSYRVSGPLTFNLVAAWPVDYDKSFSYSRLLESALDAFGNVLQADRAMLVGDLNSTTRVTKQAKTHPAFVKRARSLKLESLYHHQEKEEHGQEAAPTYRHGGRGKGRFHIDYCFLSPALLVSAKFKILDSADWEALSDHFPLVIDLAVAN